MKLSAKSALAGIACSIWIGPVLADDAAQKPPCACATAYREGEPVGSIRQVSGDVTVSQVVGFGPAKAGAALDLNSRVMVGAKGFAAVRIGTCNISVPANSNLDVSRDGKNICLLVGNTAQAAGASGFRLPAAIIGGGALLAGGIIASTHNDDNGVSR